MDKTLRIVTSSSFRIPRCTKRCRSLGGNLIHSTKVMWFKMDDLESAEKSYSKTVTCINLFWDLALLYSQVYAHQLLHYLSYQRQANCCLWCDDGWDTSCTSHDNSAGLVSYASELQVCIEVSNTIISRKIDPNLSFSRNVPDSWFACGVASNLISGINHTSIQDIQAFLEKKHRNRVRPIIVEQAALGHFGPQGLSLEKIIKYR